MARNVGSAQIRIGPQGRLVIPASFRRELGLKPGASLVAKIEGRGRLVLETQDAALGRLFTSFEKIPKGVSLAGELIAERRAEGRREDAP